MLKVRLLLSIVVAICIRFIESSPYRSRSRNSQPTYDQKQTGEYNIQLHLKDFEVIALLSDSAFGDLGDYDYSYDYSDLTVKPIHFGSTTKKPTEATTTTTTTTTHQTTPIQIVTELIHSKPIESVNQSISTSTSTPILTSTETVMITKPDSNISPIVKSNLIESSTVTSIVVIKPSSENITASEQNMPIVLHRKCSTGFTRDKLGRCRRVRRPPPPFSFGISRLATLASKLRQTNDSQSVDNVAE